MYLAQDPSLIITLKKVTEGFDSQFRAISHQLEGQEDCHPALRAQTVTHMRENRVCFEKIIQQDFDSYIRYMALLRSPGDDTTLLAVSMVYQAVVVVLHDHGAPTIIAAPGLHSGSDAMHLYIYCKQALPNDRHYDSVSFSLRQQRSEGSEALQTAEEAPETPPVPSPSVTWDPRSIGCCGSCSQDVQPCAQGQCAKAKSRKGRKKPVQRTNIAATEKAQQSFLTSRGLIVKNGFLDTATVKEQSRPRAHSCEPLRSKDPRCRASCGCCIHDEKLRRERVAKLYNGRVAMLAVLGMLDLYTGSEVAPDLQHMMAFTREYFRPRNSGGVFDPLGLLLLCEKDLCKHWLRGECKSGEKCKFAHCHPGDFSKDGMKSQPAVTNQR